MSRAGKAKTRERSYWGCTTFGCELGFDNETTGAFGPALSEDLTVCPECGGELTTITVRPRPDPPVPVGPTPEMLALAERRARGERMFLLCRARIVEKYPSLWPGEVIGASIGDQWIRNVARRMQAAVLEAQQVSARAARSGIVVPR